MPPASSINYTMSRRLKKPTCHDDGGDGKVEESKDFHPWRENLD